MIVGVPKELKSDEYRVAMTPVGVEELTRTRHTILIETGDIDGLVLGPLRVIDRLRVTPCEADGTPKS